MRRLRWRGSSASPESRLRSFGASKPGQLEDLVKAVNLKLSQEELKSLSEPYRPHVVLGHHRKVSGSGSLSFLYFPPKTRLAASGRRARRRGVSPSYPNDGKDLTWGSPQAQEPTKRGKRSAPGGRDPDRPASVRPGDANRFRGFPIIRSARPVSGRLPSAFRSPNWNPWPTGESPQFGYDGRKNLLKRQ